MNQQLVDLLDGFTPATFGVASALLSISLSFDYSL